MAGGNRALANGTGPLNAPHCSIVQYVSVHILPNKEGGEREGVCVAVKRVGQGTRGDQQAEPRRVQAWATGRKLG
jgi:hypothetical protein